jgi:hypothetical protein
MKTKATLWACLFLACGAAHAAEPVVGNGLLVGAVGVAVQGVLYDVEFKDGSCISLFSGCDALSDLPFATGAQAITASQALLDQVFLDGPLGSFDSRPSLIRGCGDNTGQGFCGVLTPADIQVNNVLAQNATVEAGDLLRGAITLRGEDMTAYDTVVYAVWTPQVPVPEPAALGLFAAGLALLGGLWRRTRQR